MATTLTRKRYIGQNVKVALTDGRVVGLVNFGMEHMTEDDNCKGSESPVQQRVTISEDASASAKVYISDEFNPQNVEANTPVAGFAYDSMKDGEGSMMSARFWAKFPPTSWKINKVSVEQDDKPGQMTVALSPNYLDIEETV